MNDFTKDELTILFLELNIAIRNWGEAKELNGYPKLQEKIQSMIDELIEQEPCIHYWIAEQAELLLPGYDAPLTPTLNRIKCSMCGVSKE